MNADELKRMAAAKALTYVTPGMRLGLGTGSTARHLVDLLGAQVRDGFEVLCVPTSETTRAQAASLHIPLTTLDETPELDLTIDGADEIDPNLNLVKGGGGALLREKIVASASRQMLVIADETKLVQKLGAFPLPVEVIAFGFTATRRHIAAVLAENGCKGDIVLRKTKDGLVFVTDSGHWIVDCHIAMIPDAGALALGLSLVVGVVEHGLFIGLANGAIIAGGQGIGLIGDHFKTGRPS